MMKRFIRNVPFQITIIFTSMMICFMGVSLIRGVEKVLVTRLIELLFVAVLGGILMEFAFGKCVFKQMSDVKRICTFILPFAIVTFICAVVFGWITRLNEISTYIKFIGMFLIGGLVSLGVTEVEHILRGRQYTQKLKDYQNRSEADE